MWQRSRSDRAAERGVSMIEFLIYITLVIIILAGSAQVLFSMRRSTTRMELEAEARQTARQAVEYIGRFIRGATDMNNVVGANNPFAILVWYQVGSTSYQSSWNNVTNTSLADAGTDIITVAYPVNNFGVPCQKWPGFGSASTAWWQYEEGCPNDALNMQLFKQATGAHLVGSKTLSEPLMVIGANGAAGWYQITNYQQSDCSANPPVIHVVANPGLSEGLNPPGGQPSTQPVTMVTGPRFVAFRVRNGWLEQKDGIFRPDKDNPDSTTPSPWHRVLPNVEDLQIAWVFRDGTIWNTSPTHQLSSAGSYTNSVPSQVGNGTGTVQTYDVTNVVGIRVTVTAVSSAGITWERSARFFRPAAEDHAAGTTRDKRYHRRMTQIVMIRNRNLGQ